MAVGLPFRPSCPPAPLSGGAGNRTLVRIRIRNRVYVHRLDFLPFRRTGIEPACPEISLACSRHRAVRHRGQPARLCDTVGTPQAGFRHRRCVSELSSAYAASASSELAVDTFQTVLPGAWTWARSNSLNEPVEADRPHLLTRTNITRQRTERFLAGLYPTARPPAASTRFRPLRFAT